MAPLSGLAFALLFGIGSGIWAFDQPSRGAETGEVRAFFEDGSTEILIGGTLSLISLPFLVWFGAVVRERLLEAEASAQTGLPLVAFAGTILLGAVGFGAETINMAAALSAEDGQLTDESAQIFFDLTYAFGAHSASVAIAIVAIPTGLTAVRTNRVMPRWAGWAAIAFGLMMLSPMILNRGAFLALYSLTVMLTAAFSVYLWRSSSSELGDLR